ncbi:MAG: diaminopimelate decarboxylase, partial [Anaerovorax sp.]
NIGGGFGIHYTDADDKKSYDYFLNPVMAKIEQFFSQANMDRPAVVIEPGRSIVGEAGITLYKIGNIKSIPNTRTYAAVDGGMTDNIRYPLYDALYEGVVANKMDFPKDQMVTVCGKCCESGDILIKDIPLPKLKRDDVFAMFSTGAYGYSMASNYNKNPIPPVILVKDGHSQIIVKGQSYEDLVARDQALKPY